MLPQHPPPLITEMRVELKLGPVEATLDPVLSSVLSGVTGGLAEALVVVVIALFILPRIQRGVDAVEASLAVLEECGRKAHLAAMEVAAGRNPGLLSSEVAMLRSELGRSVSRAFKQTLDYTRLNSSMTSFARTLKYAEHGVIAPPGVDPVTEIRDRQNELSALIEKRAKRAYRTWAIRGAKL